MGTFLEAYSFSTPCGYIRRRLLSMLARSSSPARKRPTLPSRRSNKNTRKGVFVTAPSLYRKYTNPVGCKYACRSHTAKTGGAGQVKTGTAQANAVSVRAAGESSREFDGDEGTDGSEYIPRQKIEPSDRANGSQPPSDFR